MNRYRKRRAAVLTLIIFIVSFILSYAVEKQALPLLSHYAETQGVSAVTEIINETVKNTLEENGTGKFDFIFCEKNEKGEITAVRVDAQKLNLLKASLSSNVVKELRKIGDAPIKIPAGTLSGLSIFYGRGPDIRIKLIPEGGITCDIETEFEKSGINQTVHRIYWTVETKFFAVLPDETISFEVPSRFLLAETVIVGTAPEVYFQNQGE